ncbi:stage II sporulation protein D [Ruminococcus sp.]|uniref:stage II sporulation protein D n=1 Tax=Ruminococcus sp. TaxID=41978 RepID=UPI0026012D60|nr:stage II sporulation protein D [Ruminococcus sp.]MBQ8965791.1 stage II sporulation protein D [Ruminococcus sp.]
MKEELRCGVVLVICLALIPCLVFLGKTEEQGGGFTVGVYLTKEDRVEEYTLDEYVTGAVLAQMPADFCEEALKAQAVLARTYILRRYESEQDKPDPALHGALISDDANVCQSFFSPSQAEAFYGADYAKARKRAEKAVREAGEILTCNGEPVICAYHTASSGHTESALTAWGQDIPYLQAVESGGDSRLEGLESRLELSAEEFTDIAQKLGAKGKWGADDPISAETNERGYVTELRLFGTKVNVQKFVSLAGLASPCFEFEAGEKSIDFTAKGYGHLVGMSQYGANAMAEEGASYKEILAHYFQGAELKNFS